MELVDENPQNENSQNEGFRPWDMEEKNFCMIMHLSLLSSFVVPFGGIVMPIVMWSSYKDKSERIDKHGRNIINFMLSNVIYVIVSFVLCFVFIGFLMLFALAAFNIICAIIGGVRASEGRMYKYPLSIRFLS